MRREPEPVFRNTVLSGVLADTQNAGLSNSHSCLARVLLIIRGYAVAQLVEALHYKPEGRGFDSRWSHWDFSVT
jgi:hypothetical protein